MVLQFLRVSCKKRCLHRDEERLGSDSTQGKACLESNRRPRSTRPPRPRRPDYQVSEANKIVENNAPQLGMPQISRAAQALQSTPDPPCPSLMTPISELCCDSRSADNCGMGLAGACLVFDHRDPDLRILGMSEDWSSLFGAAEVDENLFAWFGPKLIVDLQVWMQGALSTAPKNARQNYRTVRVKYPNGAKVKVMISLTFPDPADYAKADERAYFVMLSAEAVSRGPRSSCRGRSSKSQCKPLETISEDPCSPASSSRLARRRAMNEKAS